MQERLLKLTNDVSEKWQGLSKQQQMRLALGIIGLIFAIGATIFILTRPNMVTLYNNENFVTISEIEDALNEAGIRNNIIQNGRGIEVREEDVAIARLEIEGRSDIFTEDSFLLSDMLNNTNMSTSESTRREMSRAAQQSEIEIMLRQLDGIDDARVILNIPDGTLRFLAEGPAPTATVFLTTSINIDSQRALTIANSVAGAVEGLVVENINIMNQNAQTIFDGAATDDGNLNVDLDLERQRRNQIEYTAFQLLSPMYDDVRVMSHIVLNQDITDRETRTVSNPLGDDSSTGLITNERTFSEEASGTPVAAIEPGVGANNLGVPGYMLGAGTETEASRQEAERTFIYNEQIERTQAATGYILPQESSLSAAVYNYRVFDQATLNSTGQLADTTWEEFKIENANPVPIEIDETIINALILGSGIQDLTIIGFELPIFLDEVPQPINWYGIALFIILAALISILAYALIRRTQQEEVIEVEPELSVEDLLVSTRIEEEKEKEEAEAEKLKDINFSVESEVKTQIEKFVNEKPEAVAQLLRSWMNDGWE